MGFIGYAILQVLNISTDLALFNPAGASAIVNGIIDNSIAMSELWKPIMSSTIGIIVLFSASLYIFRRQEI
ncbi:MAG: hypothetical protein PF513_06675 [Tenericutes bacterium]|jgi:hypothetical protein|nr:hypothetical protein [Mycoplasmatota bacterium]